MDPITKLSVLRKLLLNSINNTACRTVFLQVVILANIHKTVTSYHPCKIDRYGMYRRHVLQFFDMCLKKNMGGVKKTIS